MPKFARTLYAVSFAATLVSALGANGSTARAQEPQGGPPSGAQERPSLPFPTSREPEIKPYDDLEEVYNSMIGQWRLEMGHVTALVGGFNTQQKHVGQDGVLFTPISKERQIEAVRFLNDNVFATPAWMLNPEILRRIETNGALTRVRTAQQTILSQLMSPARFARLIEQEAIDGDKAYRPVDFLTDVRKGIWGEVNGTVAAAPKIDAYRRNLQRAYLDMMNDRLNGR